MEERPRNQHETAAAKKFLVVFVNDVKKIERWIDGQTEERKRKSAKAD
jgi:hypothetical protein